MIGFRKRSQVRFLIDLSTSPVGDGTNRAKHDLVF